MTKLDEPATKRDVEEIVGRVVGEIVGDALQLIAGQFDGVNSRFKGINNNFKVIDNNFKQIGNNFKQIDKRFDKQDIEIKSIKTTVESMQKDILKIDNKLDVVTVVQEDHGIRIKKLEPKFA